MGSHSASRPLKVPSQLRCARRTIPEGPKTKTIYGALAWMNAGPSAAGEGHVVGDSRMVGRKEVEALAPEAWQCSTVAVADALALELLGPLEEYASQRVAAWSERLASR